MNLYKNLAIRLLLLLTLMATPVLLFAQFSDSVNYYLKAASSGSINLTDANQAYLLNNAGKFSIGKKRITLNANGSYIYGKQNGITTNNDMNGSLDFNIFNKTPGFYYWGLANYDHSYSLKINNRYQAGAGAAYYVFNNPILMLNLSDGILYEYSDIYKADNTHEFYNTARNSLRIQLKLNIIKVFTLEGVQFVQNSLLDGSDYIIKSNYSLSVKLRKWISFTSGFTYNKNNRTKTQNTLITYGITLERYF